MQQRFHPGYREKAVLADGTPVVLRLLRPEDKPLLAEGLARLSVETRYRRFFEAKTSLSEAELRYLTEIDGVRHFAIGALLERPGQPDLGLGIARFVELPDQPGVAEPAIVVVDEYQHRGLGRLLLERLVAAARERGLRAFSGMVLAGNEPLITLLEEHVPSAVLCREDGVVAVQLPLGGPLLAPDAAAPPEPPPGPPLVYQRLLSLAGKRAFVLLSSLTVLSELGDMLRPAPQPAPANSDARPCRREAQGPDPGPSRSCPEAALQRLPEGPSGS
jgi:GNAT superfamily N-acetyltransferase